MQSKIPTIHNLDICVGSLLIYPSKGTSSSSKEAKAIIKVEIKQGSQKYIEAAVKRIPELLALDSAADFDTSLGILIPVPGHAPVKTDWLNVPKLICDEINRVGYGNGIKNILRRKEKITQSSKSAAASNRPNPSDHYRTIEVDYPRQLLTPEENPNVITLIDDVVTRGSTIAGCALHLKRIFPDCTIQALTLARVDGNCDLEQVRDMFAPSFETIQHETETDKVYRNSI